MAEEYKKQLTRIKQKVKDSQGNFELIVETARELSVLIEKEEFRGSFTDTLTQLTVSFFFSFCNNNRQST